MDSLPAPAPLRAMTFFAAAGITLGARFLLDFLRELAEAARPGALDDIVTFAASFAIAHLLFIFVIVRVWSPEGSLREVLGLRRAPLASLVLAPIAGAALYAPLAKLDSVIAARFPLTHEEQQIAEKLGDTSTWGHKIGLAVTFLLVLPIVTELFFRGALYGRLRKERTEGIAALGATLFFALSSFDPRTMASTLGLGAAVTWLRARTGSTAPAILTHAGFFLTMMLPVFLHGELADDARWSARVVVVGAVVACVTLLAALVQASASSRAKTLRELDAS